MSKKANRDCSLRLKELIEEVVLPDIEEQIDEIFAVVAKDKQGKEKHQEELEELHEMRNEFKSIIEEIDNHELEQDECEELFNEIIEMISEEE